MLFSITATLWPVGVIIDAAKKRGEKSMINKLAGELVDASEQKGSAMKKREETLRMAEANKAFSHYRW